MEQQLKVEVLIVDDEPDTEPLFRLVFEDQCWHMHFATDPLAALPAVKTNPHIGVVLLDVIMPGIDGLQLLAELRQHDPTLVVCMMTGQDDMATIRAAMNSGAYDFLTKPIKSKDVIVTVNRAIEHHRKVRQLYAEKERLLQERAALIAALQEMIATATELLHQLNAAQRIRRRTEAISRGDASSDEYSARDGAGRDAEGAGIGGAECHRGRAQCASQELLNYAAFPGIAIS